MQRERRKGKNVGHMSSHLLSDREKKACQEKFESYKTLGNAMLSKAELKKVFLELGQEITEEQLLEMIYEADPNGHGYICYEAFEKIVENFKQAREETVCAHIGLTFDEILKVYRELQDNDLIENISWDFLQIYLETNFGLKINIKSLRENGKSELTR